jgi:hypothetical protein
MPKNLGRRPSCERSSSTNECSAHRSNEDVWLLRRRRAAGILLETRLCAPVDRLCSLGRNQPDQRLFRQHRSNSERIAVSTTSPECPRKRKSSGRSATSESGQEPTWRLRSFLRRRFATSRMQLMNSGAIEYVCGSITCFCIRDIKETVDRKRRMEPAGTWRAVPLERDRAKPKMLRSICFAYTLLPYVQWKSVAHTRLLSSLDLRRVAGFNTWRSFP